MQDGSRAASVRASNWFAASPRNTASPRNAASPRNTASPRDTKGTARW